MNLYIVVDIHVFYPFSGLSNAVQPRLIYLLHALKLNPPIIVVLF